MSATHVRTEKHRLAVSAARLDVLTGRRFSRLLVLSRSENSSDGKPMWLCACDCGATVAVRAVLLRNGRTTSCGCFAKELLVKRSSTHRMTRSREWETWHRMKQRCLDKNRSNFSYYGGRGIRVCERWMHSFESFMADMGTRPGDGYSIERLDHNGNYEPGNCKWATLSEQNRNKRSNVWLKFKGKRVLAADLAREYGVSQGCLRYRIARGIPLDRPVRRKVSSANV